MKAARDTWLYHQGETVRTMLYSDRRTMLIKNASTPLAECRTDRKAQRLSLLAYGRMRRRVPTRSPTRLTTSEKA